MQKLNTVAILWKMPENCQIIEGAHSIRIAKPQPANFGLPKNTLHAAGVPEEDKRRQSARPGILPSFIHHGTADRM